MDEIIDARFERVEGALATLIHSISTYNPAPALANDLVAADADLSRSFEQLTVHQDNYAKILSLRATSNALDTQIRETLTLLTNTRADLLATPSTTFPPNANPVSYSELLSYARRISKFTLPPTYREPEARTNVESTETENTSPKESQSQSQTNGATTPVTVTNGVDASAMEIDSIPPPGTVIPAEASQTSQNTGVTANTTEWAQFLGQPSDQVWTPWPTEETIRRGALASIQILVDQGVDPATFDPEKSAELEAARREKMEEDDRQRDLERARLEEERRREMERRMSVSSSLPGQGRVEKSAVFQLETFDDDEDDE